MFEQRRTLRTRTLLGCRVEFTSGAFMDCAISDLSASGARIELPGAIMLPHAFRVFVAKHGQWRTTRLRWQRLDAVGVEFEACEAVFAPDPSGAGPATIAQATPEAQASLACPDVSAAQGCARAGLAQAARSYAAARHARVTVISASDRSVSRVPLLR